MTYGITLVESDEGWAVSCDQLPGCCSQGATRAEAVANIREAMAEYLAAQAEEISGDASVRSVAQEIVVVGASRPKRPGIRQKDAVRVLEKCGFRVLRQGKHATMSNGVVMLQVPRPNPVNAYTMGYIPRLPGSRPNRSARRSECRPHAGARWERANRWAPISPFGR